MRSKFKRKIKKFKKKLTQRYRLLLRYISLFQITASSILSTNCQKKAKITLWVLPCYPQKISHYLKRIVFIRDLCAWAILRKHYRVKIRLGMPKFEEGEQVYFNPNSNYLPSDESHLTQIHEIFNENPQTQFYPNLGEILWWENKAFMHQKFTELDIKCPETLICQSSDQLESALNSMGFPCMIKLVKSYGGKGVFRIESQQHWQEFKKEQLIYPLLVQEFINMRRDLRVIYAGGELFHYFWRINKSSQWQQTFLQFGTHYLFEDFPSHWASQLQDYYIKVGTSCAAFDVVWRGDDLSTEPLVFEVSPYYHISPQPRSANFHDQPYEKYLNSLQLFDNYHWRLPQEVYKSMRLRLRGLGLLG